MYAKEKSSSKIFYLNVVIMPIHQYQAFHPCQYHSISIHDPEHYSARNHSIEMS